MTVRWFPFILVLFYFPGLANEGEKLVIVPVSINDDVPEDVRKAVQALGVVNGKTGFFINKGLFVAPIATESGEGPAPFGFSILFQYREVTQREVEMTQHLQEGEIVIVTAGQVQLAKSYVANQGSWGIFKVNGEDETELFTAKLTTFLKFSEFQGGDRVFLLSNYYYKPKNLSDNTFRKRNLMLRIVNPHIKNIGTDIDWERSFMSERLRVELNNAVAVNQRGEVIGFIRFIRLKNKTNKLVRIASDLTDFFSRKNQGTLIPKKVNGSRRQPYNKKTVLNMANGTNSTNRYKSCVSQFNHLEK